MAHRQLWRRTRARLVAGLVAGVAGGIVALIVAGAVLGATTANANMASNAAAVATATATATATAASTATATATDKPGYAPVTAGKPLVFPADYGSHPQFRTEWWYVTGWLTTQSGESLGFQITFFRSKPDIDESNPSAFAPRQLLIAHCAISDPKRGRMWQDQRIRRAGLGLAEAAQGDVNVWLDEWSLKRSEDSYAARVDAENFSLDLNLRETQDVLINGEGGVSHKAASSESASYYYSLPHMKVTGRVIRDGRTDRVLGEAWFDHEWSSQYLDNEAVGWDWIGINLNDGGALMAFRIRGAEGATRWAGGTLRTADGRVQVFAPGDIEFRAVRDWVSPRTAIRYPVEWRVRAGSTDLTLVPLMNDQENDTRLSTGAIYWEGAVTAMAHDRLIGRGYLELTGYGEKLRLR
jgi:predicted secreted hydrolase